MESHKKRPWGVTGLVAFFVIAAGISGAAALSLALPHSPLDAIWKIKPAARADFAQMGSGAVALLGAVYLLMTVAAIGLGQRKPWGRWVALGAFAVNFLADAIHSVREPSNLIGLPITALLIWYLVRPKTREYFSPSA